MTKKQRLINTKIERLISTRLNLDIEYVESTKIVEKSYTGGEFSYFDDLLLIEDKNNFTLTPDYWLVNRFLPNIVLLHEELYTEASINALKTIGHIASTDFGSSRQRDFGQKWANQIVGYLGEYAFSEFLKENWQIESDLGHEKGDISDYVTKDIHRVKTRKDKDFREPNLDLAIKTTKWNAIWFDIPGAQFGKSDIHIMIKLGVKTDHLFGYFKLISVFKDKILQKGLEINSLR